MSNDIQYNLQFKLSGDNAILSAIGKIEKTVAATEQNVTKLTSSTQKAIEGISNKLNLIRLDALINNINRVASGLQGISRPGADLSNSLYDLQAITGVTGNKLKEIEGYARSTAKTFGGDASASVESYKLLLSQLSPEIAKNPKALQNMGEAVAVLSKTMGGNTVAATETLTTAMNQFGVSTEDPIAASQAMAKMMNVMAAGAKEGSAELPFVKMALEQAGMAAKAANVSFEETNAAIQVLDKAGKKGAEGGTALRNALAIIGQGRFMPKDTQAALKAAGVDIAILGNNTLPLADRLKALQPVMNDGALFTKLFGLENKNAALALVNGVSDIERLTTAVTGTNTAFEQAAIVMESPIEKNKRLQARVDDLKISLFNATGGWLGYADVIGTTTQTFTNLMPLFSVAGKMFGTLTSATKLQALWTGIVSGATTIWAGAQAVFNAVMAVNPIVWVIAAIVALIGVISYVIYKTDGWGKLWSHTVKGAGLLWQAFAADATWHWDTFINGINIGLNLIKQGWYEFKNAVGLGEHNENDSILAKIHADTEARKTAILDGQKKVAELYGKSGSEFSAAASSLKWNSEKTLSGAITNLKQQVGITPTNTMPGAVGKINTGNTSNVGGFKKMNHAIVTGGTKSTTVNVSISKMVGIEKVETNDFNHTNTQMHDAIIDNLTRAVAMGAALGGTANE